MLFSLPGMTRELSTTVSPFSMCACLWLSTAARDRAHIGSPCVPLIITITSCGGIVLDLPGIDQQALGNIQIAQVLRDFGGLDHRAARQTRLCACDCSQFHRNADAVNRGREAARRTARRLAREKISSSRGRTARSLGV